MTGDQLTDWDEDVTLSADEEYEALVRAVSWSQGFGLLFVDCSPSEGENLIGQIQEDVKQKTVDVLCLTEEIEDLQQSVSAHPNIQSTQVLFVTGLEKSLVEYIEAGFGSEGKYYAKDSIPKLLGKLNLQRESFKERFPICFVFLVPHYAMKYLIRRAADFFDWRSGVWEFLPSEQVLSQEKSRILYESDFSQYLTWSTQKRQERCLEIDDLLSQPTLSNDDRVSLLLEQGNIFVADQNYQKAIASFDKALEFKPNDDQAWYNRGFALDELGCFEEAIASFDKALEFKPNDDQAWYNRGIALRNLGRYEDAIASYDKALEFKPSKDEAIYNKACCYALWNKPDRALEYLKKAIALNPKYLDLAKTDSDFDNLRSDPRFQSVLRQ